ncbi:MAG: MmgE/PrpD family protein [SAR324 cluster bacterium]|nr:MmgE/PrpD family protein [SAR324 cluster bacterium]
METNLSITEQLAQFICEHTPEKIPASLLNGTRGFVLDWLGCVLAGSAFDAGKHLMEYANVQEQGSCTIFGTKQRKGVETAALVNGGLCHVTEMDDLHRTSVIHPAAPVISAAFAVAEQKGKSGRELLDAIILGYEVAIRIGESVGKSHYKIWHNTATCGVFGAAAAAGYLYELSAEQMTWALGNAGTMASGLWEFNAEGAMSKALHTGKAASNGIAAAQLACFGFTGARAILEGKRGFFAATSHDAEPEKVTLGISSSMSHYRILTTSIKPYASCRHTHPAIDAALQLRKQYGIKSSHIAKIQVETYQAALDLTSNPDPAHVYGAKFSLPYCTAVAFHLGHAGLEAFNPEIIANSEICNLMKNVTLCHSPELEVAYPEKWSSSLQVTLHSGETLEHYIDSPKGDPENPLSLDELNQKFYNMLQYVGLESKADALIQQIRKLENLPDLRPVLQIL